MVDEGSFGHGFLPPSLQEGILLPQDRDVPGRNGRQAVEGHQAEPQGLPDRLEAERRTRIAEPHPGIAAVEFHPPLLGALPGKPVVNGKRRRQDSNPETVVPRAFAIVVVFAVVGESRREESCLPEASGGYHPVGGHHEPDRDDFVRGLERSVVVTTETPVGSLQVRAHLHGTQYSPLPFSERVQEFLEGVGHHPGILVEKVDIVIAVFQGMAEPDVVGTGEPEVLPRTDQHGRGAMAFHEIGGTVRGPVVADEYVGVNRTRDDGVEATLQPLHSVIGDDYDQQPFHLPAVPLR